jgi:signal transduction histidine kinase
LVEELQLGSGNNHTIAFCSQGECTDACMDEKLLRYILSNLLSNAVKYSEQLFNSFHRASNVGTISGTGLGKCDCEKVCGFTQGYDCCAQ